MKPFIRNLRFSLQKSVPGVKTLTTDLVFSSDPFFSCQCQTVSTNLKLNQRVYIKYESVTVSLDAFTKLSYYNTTKVLQRVLTQI